MERYSVIIVGAGPAGCATALFLQRLMPECSRDILLLDKAVHPRFKVCAGGLIPHTLACMEELGVPLRIPHVRISKAVVSTPVGSVEHEEANLCTVVRRDEFDALLVSYCIERGIAVRQGEAVRRVVVEETGVQVETERATYRASLIVGADGSGSAVRRQLFGEAHDWMGRAVMADIPLAATNRHGSLPDAYEFDFRPVRQGLRGYAWIFPCLIDGTPHWNVGVYSARAKGSGALGKDVFRQLVAQLGVEPEHWQAWPIRCFRWNGPIARPRALLVGDAAGVDPLMGEGISYAFEFGRFAALAIVHALRTRNFALQSYEDSVRRGWLGRKLRRLGWLEHLFYGPAAPLLFRLALASTTARSIGVRWYNGVDGWDQRSAWEALGSWWRLRNNVAN